MSIENGRSTGSITRRAVVKAGAATAAASAIVGSSLRSSFAQDASPAATPQVPAGAIVSDVEGVPVAYTQYPEPFASTDGVPGNGDTVTMLTLSYSPPPTSKDDNTYWQQLEERLGVTYDADVTPISGYGEKIATVFAGGDLPDLFYLLPGPARPVIYEAIDQGAFFDMTDFIESGGLARTTRTSRRSRTTSGTRCGSTGVSGACRSRCFVTTTRPSTARTSRTPSASS